MRTGYAAVDRYARPHISTRGMGFIKDTILKDTILSVLFPQKCPVCGKIVKEDDTEVCRKCKPKLPVITGPRCPKCSKPVETDGVLCSDCKSSHFTYVCGYAMWNYNYYTRKLIAQFKYEGRRDYAQWLATELTYHMADFIKSIKPDALVPVPLHVSRYRQRGFNQAEIIAEGISRKTGIMLMPDVVVRSKKTTPQKKLNDMQRSRNISDAFAINEDNLKKYGNVKTALIIDDIYTTGSTIDACAQVLKKAGIESYFAALCIGAGF